MATEIIEIDAPWAEKWTKTRVSFLSAPTVYREKFRLQLYYYNNLVVSGVICDHIYPLLLKVLLWQFVSGSSSAGREGAAAGDRLGSVGVLVGWQHLKLSSLETALTYSSSI